MFNGKPYTILNNAIDAQSYRFDKQIREEMREQLGFNQEDFVIGHVGRFNPQKNHNFIIDVFNFVHKKNAAAKLVLVGTGDGQKAIKEKVESLVLSDSVLFLGNRTDVNKILQAMDVFLFPSLYEGLPLSIIEAQAAGLPCVISDNVPPECIVTDLIEAVSLDDALAKWEIVITSKKSVKRKDTYELIKKSGFDVKSNVLVLEKMYYTDLS